MVNEIIKYDPQAFAVTKVYERLVKPLEGMEPLQKVNTIAVGVGTLRKKLEDVVNLLKDSAVEEQKKVVGETDKFVQKTYAGLDSARKSNDFEAYDKVGTDVINAIKIAKGDVTNLRLLQNGDFDSYVKNQRLLEGNGGEAKC